ncbi:MAG: sigma-70 family RNA polymerase sigma factor [Betaproteobacteria bacterium]
MPSHLIDSPGAPCTAEHEPVAADEVEVDDAAAQYGAGDDELGDETPEQFRASAVTGSIPRGDSEMLAALVRRIVYQDQAALAIFYRALSSRVFIQAMRITRDVGCAQEVVEDVFWQVWRQAPRFDPQRGTALAWVCRIARSRALDALRALGRDPLRWAVDLDGDDMAEPGSGHDDPARRMGEAQVAALLEMALAALNPLRRQLVALAFQRGYSQSEIAERTGLPLGTVKSNIRRALTLMKVSIEAAGGPQLSPSGPD